MMFIVKVTILFLLSTCYLIAFECDSSFVVKTFSSTNLSGSACVSNAMSVEEIESLEMTKYQAFLSKYEGIMSDDQKAKFSYGPWGRKRSEWESFIGELKIGDQIRAYSNTGSQGYIVVRNNYVIRTFLTIIN